MFRTNETIRTLAMLTAVVMFLCIGPIVGFAEGTENIVTLVEPTLSAETGVVDVSGTIALDGVGLAAEVTILAVRESDALTDTSTLASLSEDTIVYIDQITAEEDGSFDFSFLPRDTVNGEQAITGKYITIFVGGDNVETFGAANIKTLELPIGAAGTVTATEDAFILDFDDVVFDVDVTGAAAGWADIIATNTTVWEGETQVTAANVSYADSKITITGLGLAAGVDQTTFTLEIDGSLNDLEDVAVDFTVVSPTKAAYDELPSGVAVVYDGTEPATDPAKVTIPTIAEAYGTDIAWGFVTDVAGETTAIEGITGPTDGVYELVRNSETSDATLYFLKATVSLGDLSTFTKVYTLSVNAIGVAGPALTEDNVTLIGTTAVYGKTGYKVVEIAFAQGETDYANNTVKIGDVSLFYSEARELYVGIVAATDAAAVVAGFTYVSGASELLHYGKTTPTYDATTAPMAADFGVAKRIVLGKETAATDKQLLAADVSGGAASGSVMAADFGALKRRVLKKDTDLAINSNK